MDGKFHLNCRKLLRLPQNGIRMNLRPICLGTDNLKNLTLLRNEYSFCEPPGLILLKSDFFDNAYIIQYEIGFFII